MRRPTLTIYALLDPRTQDVRYVGQTVNPERRLGEYAECRAHRNVRLYRWLDGLRRRGLEPVMRTLESGLSPVQADQQEAYWIRRFRAEEAPLLNICDGAGRAITRALRTPKSEWLEVAQELARCREKVRRLKIRLERIAGKTSSRRLERALRELDHCREELEVLAVRHYPEWQAELTEALYE